MPHTSLPHPVDRKIPARQAALSVEEERLWASLAPPIKDTSTGAHFIFDIANRDGPNGRRSSVHEHDREYQYMTLGTHQDSKTARWRVRLCIETQIDCDEDTTNLYKCDLIQRKRCKPRKDEEKAGSMSKELRV